MNASNTRPDVSRCPVCGTWGAKKSLFKVKCVNPACRKYDAAYASEYQHNRIVGRLASEALGIAGNVNSGKYSLRIRYKNFRGDEMIYLADPATGYKKSAYLVIRVAPSGQRITFRLSSIQNRSDMESQIPQGPFPSPRERRVLSFHLRKGTTSPLFKQIRAKFPDYQP